MNSKSKIKVIGVDLFFRGYKSSIMKLLNEIKVNCNNSDSVTYYVASKVSPIYYDYEHCITIKFGSEIECTYADTIDLLEYNKMRTKILIQTLKLKNIEYLGSELYIPKIDNHNINEIHNAA